MLWSDFQQPMYNFDYNNNNTTATAIYDNSNNHPNYHVPKTDQQQHQLLLQDHQQQQLPYTIRKDSLNSSSGSSSHSEEDRQPRRKQRRSNITKAMDENDEKRKNFLERNRQAALKCRQRKKQWLNNLQARVEYLSNDNEQLQIQTNVMRDEVIHLRSILMAHKNCRLNNGNGNNKPLQDHLLQQQTTAAIPNYMNNA